MTETRPVRALARFLLPMLTAAGIAGPAGVQPDRLETGGRAVLEVLVLDPDGKQVAGLTADRGELIVDGSGQSRRDMFSSTTYGARQRAASPRSGDDILSSVAAETGGLYFAPATGFRKALDRIEDRNRFWYRLTLVGEVGAGERESQVLQVRVPGCSRCTVLPAPSAAPE